MTLRVRFAPSPTGYLHVGGARTALFNWLLARREEGAFILRIEDTDRERSTEEHTRAILDGLSWLGITWDEGPFFQSEGLERHKADALSLLAGGRAYRDFSTPEQAAEDRAEEVASGRRNRRARERADAMAEADVTSRVAAGEPFAVRFRVPTGETVWDDGVHGEMRFRNDEIDDLVILRSDGTPTYNLAVVSDDAEMEISLVMRGDDHLSNTPKQILLYQALGRQVPRFAHVPLILGPDGKRLSKRHGATAVGDYEGEGILPEAMMNFLAFLGWSPGDDREVFTPQELVEAFSLERVLKKSSVFDLKKLEWLNGQHLMRTPTQELVPQVEARLKEEGFLGADQASGQAPGVTSDEVPLDLDFLVEILKPRSRTLQELVDQAAPYLQEGVSYDPSAVKKHWTRDSRETLERLRSLRSLLVDTPWEGSELEGAIRGMAESMDLGVGKVIQPLRLALTGVTASPGIFDVLRVLGRRRSLQRLDAAIDALTSGGLPKT